jgi:hypothetical protein
MYSRRQATSKRKREGKKCAIKSAQRGTLLIQN